MFDSVALIDWYCGRGGVASYFEPILAGEEQGAFSTVTELELWQGIRVGEEKQHEAMLAFLERVPLDSVMKCLRRPWSALHRQRKKHPASGQK